MSLTDRECTRCGAQLEPARPRHTKYCLLCGNAIKAAVRRESDGNAKVREWRNRNQGRYRAQNNEHVRACRARQRQALLERSDDATAGTQQIQGKGGDVYVDVVSARGSSVGSR